MKHKFTIIYIVIFSIIIWDALRVYIFNSIIFGYLLLPIIFIGFLILIIDKKNLENLFSFPTIFWFLWVIYGIINTFFIHNYINDQSPLMFIFSMLTPLFLILCVNYSKCKINKLIIVFISAYTLRMLLSYLFDSSAIIGTDSVARFGIVFNSNAIAFGALYLIVLIIIKKESSKHFSIILFFLICLAIYTIINSASKKVFFVLVIVLFTYFMIIKFNKDFFSSLKILLFFSIIYFGTLWVINHTSMGERITSTYIKTFETDEAEKMFDGRASFYIYGWKLFLDNPITGVGLGNYRYVLKKEAVAHSEYIVQLAECGILGSLLFLLFFVYILKKLFRIRLLYRNIQKITELYILGIVIMFIIFLGGWIYNAPVHWVFIALAIKWIKYHPLPIIMKI